MFKRQLIRCGPAAWLMILVLAMVVAFRPTGGITAENYERIEIGMTRTQVETILGGPSGNYCDDELAGWIGRAHGGGSCCLGAPPETQWMGNGYAVAITFSSEGRVRWKRSYEFPCPDFFTRLRARFGW